MSSTQPPHEGPAPDSPSDVRALPARPNLEFEHKQAKKLLAALRKGDSEALSRIHAKLKGSRDTKPDEFKLADAQFTIAREYGFTSWPRLVEYFETLVRHEVSGRLESQRDPRALEAWSRTIRVEHKEKRAWTVQFLGAYVRYSGRVHHRRFPVGIYSEGATVSRNPGSGEIIRGLVHRRRPFVRAGADTVMFHALSSSGT